MIVMTPQEIVKKLHDELHWTVEKIADKVGCSADMVRRWMREENEPRGLRRQALYKLAEKYLTSGESVRAAS